jgi:hypothetical protein
VTWAFYHEKQNKIYASLSNPIVNSITTLEVVKMDLDGNNVETIFTDEYIGEDAVYIMPFVVTSDDNPVIYFTYQGSRAVKDDFSLSVFLSSFDTATNILTNITDISGWNFSSVLQMTLYDDLLWISGNVVENLTDYGDYLVPIVESFDLQHTTFDTIFQILPSMNDTPGRLEVSCFAIYSSIYYAILESSTNTTIRKFQGIILQSGYH